MCSIDAAVTSVTPALKSTSHCHFLQPFTAKVRVRIHGDVSNVEVRAELWSNIPDAVSPVGDWHSIPMYAEESCWEVYDRTGDKDSVFNASPASQTERKIYGERAPHRLRRRMIEYREYVATVLPVKPGEFEMTARVALEPKQWSPETHLSFPLEFQQQVRTLLLCFQRPGTSLHSLRSKDLLFHILHYCAPVMSTCPQWLWAGDYQANSRLVVSPPPVGSLRIPLSPADVSSFSKWFADSLEELLPKAVGEAIDETGRTLNLKALNCMSLSSDLSPPARSQPSLSLSFCGSQKQPSSLRPLSTGRVVSASSKVRLAYAAALVTFQVQENLAALQKKKWRRRIPEYYLLKAVCAFLRSLSWLEERGNSLRVLLWAFGSQKIVGDLLSSFEDFQFSPSQRSGMLKRHTSSDIVCLADAEAVALEVLLMALNESFETMAASTDGGLKTSPRGFSPLTPSLPSTNKLLQLKSASSAGNSLVMLELGLQSAQNCDPSAITPSLILRLVHDIQHTDVHVQKVYLYQLLKSFSLRSDAPSVPHIVFQAIVQALLQRSTEVEPYSAVSGGMGLPDKGEQGLRDVKTDAVFLVGDVEMLLKICLDVFLNLESETRICTVLVPAIVKLLNTMHDDEAKEFAVLTTTTVEIARRYTSCGLKIMRSILRSWSKNDSSREVRALNVLSAILSVSPGLVKGLTSAHHEPIRTLLILRLRNAIRSPHVNVALGALKALKKVEGPLQMLERCEGERTEEGSLSEALRCVAQSHWHSAVRKVARETLRMWQLPRDDGRMMPYSDPASVKVTMESFRRYPSAA